MRDYNKVVLKAKNLKELLKKIQETEKNAYNRKVNITHSPVYLKNSDLWVVTVRYKPDSFV